MLPPILKHHSHETVEGRKKSTSVFFKINVIVLLLSVHANRYIEPTRPELKEKHVVFLSFSCLIFALEQEFPTPGLSNGTGPWPVRN